MLKKKTRVSVLLRTACAVNTVHDTDKSVSPQKTVQPQMMYGLSLDFAWSPAVRCGHRALETKKHRRRVISAPRWNNDLLFVCGNLEIRDSMYAPWSAKGLFNSNSIGVVQREHVDPSTTSLSNWAKQS